MAKQGILAKSKPSGATNTLLYSAPVDASASTVLTVNEQGGSGTTYDVALKNCKETCSSCCHCREC